MKNAFLATTALMLTAGIAAADVTVGGSGRFGLSYQENHPTAVFPFPASSSETRLVYRLRLNFDASVETDSGVAFGGRIRMQNSNGQTGAALSPALVYVTYEGLRVEVGNANTAYDSVALMYNPEVGFLSRSFGDPLGDYYGFNSGPYGASNINRIGVLVSYSVGGLNARLSYIDPDQNAVDINAANGNSDENVETSISVDYTMGAFTVAAAYAEDAGGISGNNLTFVGAAYAIDENTNVGLNYNDNGNYVDGPLPGDVVDNGTSITLYGSRDFGQISALAYVTNLDIDRGILPPGVSYSDTAYGIGVGYDLGGAVLSAGIEQGFNKLTRGDIGVTFNF